MWYKKLQQTKKTYAIKIANPQPYRDIPPNYFDLGHGLFDGDSEAQQDAIWVWDGRSIRSVTGSSWLSTGNSGDEFTHKRAFPGLKYENMYRGRYEKRTNSVSILKPSIAMNRPLPQPLVNELKKTYGESVKIEEF